MLESQESTNQKPKKCGKIIATGTLVIGVAVLGIIGITCQIKKDNDFKRIVQEDGSVSLDGQGNYDIVRKYRVVEVATVLGENKIFLAQEGFMTDSKQEYYDVFSEKRICSDDLETKIINDVCLEDYLIALGILKENYTIEDLETVYKTIQENYEFSEVKQKELKKGNE